MDIDIRLPDQPYFDILSNNSIELLDNDTIIALNLSSLQYNADIISKRNFEKYQLQIDKLLLEDKAKREKEIQDFNKLKIKRQELVKLLDMKICWGISDINIKEEIKKAINMFCDAKSSSILLNNTTYEILIDFIHNRVRMFSQSYVDDILKYINKIEIFEYSDDEYEYDDEDI